MTDKGRRNNPVRIKENKHSKTHDSNTDFDDSNTKNSFTLIRTHFLSPKEILPIAQQIYKNV